MFLTAPADLSVEVDDCDRTETRHHFTYFVNKDKFLLRYNFYFLHTTDAGI